MPPSCAGAHVNTGLVQLERRFNEREFIVQPRIRQLTDKVTGP